MRGGSVQSVRTRSRGIWRCSFCYVSLYSILSQEKEKVQVGADAVSYRLTYTHFRKVVRNKQPQTQHNAVK